MEIEQCNRNPLFLADFAYDGEFSDGEQFSLRIPEEDVKEFAITLLKAYEDDMCGRVRVSMPYILIEDGKATFVDGKVERVD